MGLKERVKDYIISNIPEDVSRLVIYAEENLKILNENDFFRGYLTPIITVVARTKKGEYFKQVIDEEILSKLSIFPDSALKKSRDLAREIIKQYKQKGILAATNTTRYA